MQVLIFPLIAVIFTIGLGYFAAKIGDFDEQDNKRLAKLTMKYALPLGIFVGIWATPKKQLLQYGPLALWLLLGIVGTHIVVFLIYRYVFRQQHSPAALYTLAVSSPSVPFIGSALLPFLCSANLAAGIIGLVAIIENLITNPTAIAMVDKDSTVAKKIFHTLQNPLVFGPFIGFFLVLAGVSIPVQTEVVFQTLGKAASGVALFSIGITLATNHVVFDKIVAVTVFFRNLLVPAALLVIIDALALPRELTKMVVLTLAIPVAVLPVTLAIRYRIKESTVASIQLTSTVLSFMTLSLFIYWLH